MRPSGLGSSTIVNNSPIFIVGSPRSGTGLLRDLLRAHPRITFPGESHFIPLFYRAYGDPETERDARRLGQLVLGLNWVKRWGLDLEPSSFRDCRSFRDVIVLLYEAWADKEGKERWGDKTPQYVTEIGLLRTIFPDCQLIHIYRDGRDVALSILAAGFGPQNLYTAARQWRYFVRTARAAGAAQPSGTYLDVRYEDLLNAPEETMRGVLEFLGEPFESSVLKPDFLERFVRPPIIGQPRRAYASRTEIVADNWGKWKSQMGAEERLLFESVAGDLLTELGYETEGKVRPLSSAEEFRWKAHHLLLWPFQKLNRRQKSPSTAWIMLCAQLRCLWKRLGRQPTRSSG